MRKTIPFNPLIIYTFVICLVAIGEAFALKSTFFPPRAGHSTNLPQAPAKPVFSYTQTKAELSAESDST
jgi:hypothetical protein